MQVFYDLVCAAGHEQIDVLCPMGGPKPACHCGQPTERLWKSSGRAIGDDLPGGYTVKHGLCWPDGTPRTFYTMTELRAEAKRNNLTLSEDVWRPKLPPRRKVVARH